MKLTANSVPKHLFVTEKTPLLNDYPVGCRGGSKKSRTGLMVESAIRPATGGFSAKTLCLSPIPEYVPGIGISAKSAFYGHTMRFLRIRLYLTFCIGGFRSPQLCGKAGGSELKMPDAMQACRRAASSRRRGIRAQNARCNLGAASSQASERIVQPRERLVLADE